MSCQLFLWIDSTYAVSHYLCYYFSGPYLHHFSLDFSSTTYWSSWLFLPPEYVCHTAAWMIFLKYKLYHFTTFFKTAVATSYYSIKIWTLCHVLPGPLWSFHSHFSGLMPFHTLPYLLLSSHWPFPSSLEHIMLFPGSGLLDLLFFLPGLLSPRSSRSYPFPIIQTLSCTLSERPFLIILAKASFPIIIYLLRNTFQYLKSSYLFWRELSVPFN